MQRCGIDTAPPSNKTCATNAPKQNFTKPHCFQCFVMSDLKLLPKNRIAGAANLLFLVSTATRRVGAASRHVTGALLATRAKRFTAPSESRARGPSLASRRERRGAMARDRRCLMEKKGRP